MHHILVCIAQVVTQSCDLWFFIACCGESCEAKFNKNSCYSTLIPTGLQIYQGRRQELKSGGASPSVQNMLKGIHYILAQISDFSMSHAVILASICKPKRKESMFI